MATYILYDGAYSGQQIDAYLRRVQLTSGSGALQPKLAGTSAVELAYGQYMTVTQRVEQDGSVSLVFGVPRGATGAQGPSGAQGEAAGFGVPTVTVDNGVGTPSVQIGASGPNTAKVFAFAFHNLKGKSAYMYAQDAGYTGTEAQLSADLANTRTYASNAQAAATTATQKATAAAGSATAAAGSATAAAGSATSASGSATSASGSATSASGSATSAAQKAAEASEAAQHAAVSAQSSMDSAAAASGSASAAADSARLSKSWAVGDTGIRVGEDENNSKYWAMISMQFMIRQICPVILDAESGAYYAVAVMAGRISLISVYDAWAARVAHTREVPCMVDEVSGVRYQLGAYGGDVCLIEVSDDTPAASPEFVDFVTGITYEFVASNSRIKIEEVG